MNKIELILKNLEKIDISRECFEYGNDIATVTKKHGGYLFEFVVKYSRNVKNYRSATYEQPEESDIDFVVDDVLDVMVYDFRNNGLELTDKECEKIIDAIKNMFVGEKY